MKIREGFVSNSSSTGFAHVCRVIDFEEAQRLRPEFPVLVDTRIDGPEGQMFLDRVTPRMFQVLKRAVEGEWGESLIPIFYEVFARMDSEYSDEPFFDLNDFPAKDATIIEVWIDWTSPNDEIELLDLYSRNMTW